VWWTAALLLVPGPVRPPAAGITLEAATALALALAGAALTNHRGDSARPGQAVAAFLLVGSVLGPLLVPGRWALFVTPGDPRWAAAHDRWTVLLCAAVVVGAVCATEPRRRLTLRGLRSPSGTSGPSRA
jgi:hypothetical protein